MTLIAAFRCQEGVVLCADSLETQDGVPVPVRKLEPRDCGHYWLAIAGSGTGDLIDGFIDSLRLDVQGWKPQQGENVVRGYLRNLLIDFHENEVRLYPTSVEDERRNYFIVCVKPKQSPEIFLWQLRGTVMVPVGDYALIGIDEAIYKHEIRRLYRGRPRALQAILLGVHLLSLGRETSTLVGGQTDVIFVRDSGMYPEEHEDVRELEERVAKFNQALAELVLACPDTAIPPEEFDELLEKFQGQVKSLRHDYHLNTGFAAAFRAKFDPNWQGAPYANLPPGTNIKVEGRRRLKVTESGMEPYEASPSPSPAPEDED